MESYQMGRSCGRPYNSYLWHDKTTARKPGNAGQRLRLCDAGKQRKRLQSYNAGRTEEKLRLRNARK